MKGKEKKDDQKGEIFCILKYRIYSEALSFPIHYLALKHIYIYIYISNVSPNVHESAARFFVIFFLIFFLYLGNENDYRVAIGNDLRLGASIIFFWVYLIKFFRRYILFFSFLF
jgi:hypothetical protein